MSCRMWKILAALALLAPVGQSEARAWFRFTNKTTKPVYVAFVRHSPGCEGGVPWEKKGWWRIDPGQTKTVQGDKITNRYSYYYAESDDRTLVWTSASPSTCLPQPAFTWCWNTCNNSPTTRTLGLRVVDTGDSSNHTVNLNGPSAVAAAGPARPMEDAAEGRTEPAEADGSLSEEAGAMADQSPQAGPMPASTSETESNDPMGGPSSLPTDPMDPMGTRPAAAPGRAPFTEPTNAAPMPAVHQPGGHSSIGKMPANPAPVVVAQPDGSKIALRIRGDERANWHEDLNGYPVVRVPDGHYVYAVRDARGVVKATQHVVGKADPAAAQIPKVQPTESGAAVDPMGGPPDLGPPTDPMAAPPAADSTPAKHAERAPDSPGSR
jgi:uncharacterized membrane protein